MLPSAGTSLLRACTGLLPSACTGLLPRAGTDLFSSASLLPGARSLLQAAEGTSA